MAQDTAREFGQSPAGRQFGNQLVDQAPDQASAAGPGAKKTAAKLAKSAAKSRPSPHLVVAQSKTATSTDTGKAPAAREVAVQEAAAAVSPASAPVKTSPAASASVQSGAPYAIGGGLAALLAILAGLFAFRGMRRRTKADLAKDTGLSTANAPTPSRSIADPAPAPQPRPSAEPALAAEVTPLVAKAPVVKAATPPRSRTKAAAKTETALSQPAAANQVRKRAPGKSTVGDAPLGVVAITPKVAAKPTATEMPKPQAKAAAGRRKSSAG